MAAPMPETHPPRPDDAVPELAPLGVADSALVAGRVLLPLTSRGAIARRPAVMRWLERRDLDRGAIETLRRMRDEHGSGPLRLRLPGRALAVVLDPDDARRILAGTPEPFATENLEKRAALRQFQPHNSLISHPPERGARREFQERALRSEELFHPLAGRIAEVVEQEAGALAELTGALGHLDWDDFVPAWYRIVRRVVLGDLARDDHRLTDDLAALRERANLSYLAPVDRGTRERFQRRLAQHLDRAEEGSLAATIRELDEHDVDPAEQVPQWLFAFEPAGIAVFRTLALLATHGPPQAGQAAGPASDGPVPLHGDLRAAVLESLRLWPTTPAILRDTTEPTEWRGRRLPAGTGLLLFAPLLHRDPDIVPQPDAFRPERWDPTRVRDEAHEPLVPFSAGPGTCPGRNLVLLTCSLTLHHLQQRLDVALEDPGRLDPGAPLPSMLDPFTLRFRT